MALTKELKSVCKCEMGHGATDTASPFFVRGAEKQGPHSTLFITVLTFSSLLFVCWFLSYGFTVGLGAFCGFFLTSFSKGSTLVF